MLTESLFISLYYFTEPCFLYEFILFLSKFCRVDELFSATYITYIYNNYRIYMLIAYYVINIKNIYKTFFFSFLSTVVF